MPNTIETERKIILDRIDRIIWETAVHVDPPADPKKALALVMGPFVKEAAGKELVKITVKKDAKDLAGATLRPKNYVRDQKLEDGRKVRIIGGLTPHWTVVIGFYLYSARGDIEGESAVLFAPELWQVDLVVGGEVVKSEDHFTRTAAVLASRDLKETVTVDLKIKKW